MEYFNFSHLPLLVKEMIADEIVHNSIPEDRIQFATTCKAFNQLVKHAKPKKIIRELQLVCHEDNVPCCINSGKVRIITLSEFKKILQHAQVENLSLFASSTCDEHLFSELMDSLIEPCRCITTLNINFYCPKLKYADFLKKLRHLKSLRIYDSSGINADLPYFPPKLELRSEYCLSLLAEKTLNRPLSFLKITREVQLTEIRQFLMTANLEIGAEIRFCFKNHFETFKGFVIFIGNGLFEFQMFCASDYLILDQQMNSQKKKIYKLLTDYFFGIDKRIPFTVTSVSNPDNVVYSGEFTNKSGDKIVFENVAECVKVSFPRHCYSAYYSPQLLDDWFPRTENYDPFERVKTINKTLGTNISIITPEMLEEKWCHDQCSVPACSSKNIYAGFFICQKHATKNMKQSI